MAISLGEVTPLAAIFGTDILFYQHSKLRNMKKFTLLLLFYFFYQIGFAQYLDEQITHLYLNENGKYQFLDRERKRIEKLGEWDKISNKTKLGI